jgi:cyanophycin synthetase
MDLSQSKGEWKIRIERATHVPLTLGGKEIHDCKCSGSNLSQLCLGIQTEDISLSLQTFIPSAANTRMNIFEFKIQSVVDFTHASGYKG